MFLFMKYRVEPKE